MVVQRGVDVDFNKHRAMDLPKEDRIAYLKVVASLAAADG